MAVRLSVCLDPSRPWADARALAHHVDAAGWYAVYQCDHFMPHDPEGEVVAGPVTECWTTLSALAAVTSRIRLGSLVLGASYRHPAVVASMAATLDRISDGRVVLGVGAGWQPNEHRAFGIPLLEPPSRLDAFDECCAVLRGLLDDGCSSFQGATYRLDGARCEPGPLQARLPLLIGGGGEQRTLRTAARWADAWHVWADAETFARKSAVLDAHCDDLERDPAQISRVTGGDVRVGVADVDRTVSGSIDQVVHRLCEYAAVGVDEFVVRDHGTDPVGHVKEQVDLLTRDVLPEVTG